MGTVALQGSAVVSTCVDPVAIIANHISLDIPLPEVLKEGVDVIALVDRAVTTFDERKFLLVDVGGELTIRAYNTKEEVPGEIIGRVQYVQVPWLSCMQRKSSGFEEDDELY